MAGTFPALSTGVVAQYPLQREVHFAAEVIQFLDFSEQVYGDVATQRKRWPLQFTGLSDTEAAVLKAFWESNQGADGDFTFVDPWTNTTYTTCSFEGDSWQDTQDDEGNVSVQLTIYEHP